jgi:predicted ATP-binding protein involved in virulence
MEAHNVKSYDLEGVALIDEIETHLHVDLQKRIMPFLINFFPKIQFIVTTHSPFVLSSVSNATVCDLENKTVTTDLSAYSYDALLESYFMTDKYSEIIKNKIAEYDRLSSKKNKTIEDIENINSLRDYFAHAPKYLSKELFVKLQQIELDNLK